MTGWRKRQVMEMALEALEDQRIFTMRPDHEGKELTPVKVTNAITAIKEALAQPEERNFCPRCGKRAGDYIHTCTPPQRTWVGLTNEEIDKTLRVYEQDYGWISFAKAIEAKLRERNI